MCRFLVYRGDAILLEKLVSAPTHSLIEQSLNAQEARTTTNGDGFGVGWYGERVEPGLYREVRPAWSDENLRSLCAQVRSRLFFCPCARLDGHRDDAGELPPVCRRAVHVHA